MRVCGFPKLSIIKDLMYINVTHFETNLLQILATPFENPYTPVEDFRKVHHRGSVYFQMQLPSVRFVD